MCLRCTWKIHNQGDATKQRELLLQDMCWIYIATRFLISLKWWFIFILSFVLSYTFISFLFDRRNYLILLVFFLLEFTFWISDRKLRRSWIIRRVLLPRHLNFVMEIIRPGLIKWLLLFLYIHLGFRVSLLLFLLRNYTLKVLEFWKITYVRFFKCQTLFRLIIWILSLMLPLDINQCRGMPFILQISLHERL